MSGRSAGRAVSIGIAAAPLAAQARVAHDQRADAHAGLNVRAAIDAHLAFVDAVRDLM